MEAFLTIAFSVKECLSKALFAAVGRYFGFNAARVVALDVQHDRIRLALTETLCREFVHVQQCDLGFEFINKDMVLIHCVW